MFRLNLYPEAEDKRRARVKSASSTALVAFLIAAILALTAFHAGSGLLLAERARVLQLKSEERDVAIHALPTRQTTAELGRYRKFVEGRARRTVWAPKLAELARAVRWPLAVTNIVIGERGRGQAAAGLRIEGAIPPDRRGDADGLIANFVESLKKNPTFTEGLTRIEIASVSYDKQSGSTNFQIICPVTENAPTEQPDAAEEDLTLRPERPGERP